MRSFRTCARIRSLTTGTFNLVVKDRISTPPERRESVRPRHTNVPSAVLETLQTYRVAKNPVNPRIAQDLHRFSTMGNPDRCRRPRGRAALQRRVSSKPGRGFSPCANLDRAQRYGLPPHRRSFSARRLFGPCESGRQKIERTYVWRFLALKVPFRGRAS